MKQPYVYSMPENFLRDKSVPARWRVLAVINGFILNGGCFYGSNEWLMEQLDCSEQTISNAFKELEESGDVYIERTRRTRNVYRSRPKPVGVSDPNQPRVSDPSSFGTNSVSNSVIEIVAERDLEREEKKPKPKYNNARVAFDWLPNRQKSWDRDLTQLECGLLLYERGEEAVRKFVAYVKNHEDDEGFNWVFVKPSDYERKWEDIKAYAKRNR